MASIVYPFSLTAGAVENINQLNSNLTAITDQVNGNLGAANYGNESITTGKIAAGAVTSGRIGAGQVLTSNLADNAVTSAKTQLLSVQASNSVMSQALSTTLSLITGAAVTIAPTVPSLLLVMGYVQIQIATDENIIDVRTQLDDVNAGVPYRAGFVGSGNIGVVSIPVVRQYGVGAGSHTVKLAALKENSTPPATVLSFLYNVTAIGS